MKQINILSGPVHSGKTTRLMKWLTGRSSVSGILCPVIKGKRHFYSIRTGEYRLLEADDNKKDDIVTIGKYHFFKESFIWAGQQIQNDVSQKPEWLLIDEIGPLELAGKGFHPVLQKILKKRSDSDITKLVLVIRETLVDNVLAFYDIDKDDIQFVTFI